jgi:hypothetical protein
MKRIFKIITILIMSLVIMTLSAGCESCAKGEEKEWFEDRENVIVRYYDVFAEPQVVEHDIDMAPVTRLTYTFRDELLEPQAKLFYKGEEKALGYVWSTKRWDEERELWEDEPLRYPGEYRREFIFYAYRGEVSDVVAYRPTIYITILENNI